jgi:Zn-finger nucleic acid-binding protein
MSAANLCHHCGAPLPVGASYPLVCRFCDAANGEPPREVHVPVPVQVVHNVLHVDPSAQPGVGELRCPHCKKLLVTVKVGELALAGCGRCGGIWVDNTSARSLVASPQRVVIELAERASAHTAKNAKPRTTTPTCPGCPAVLEKRRSHGVELDICDQHGTWFDSYELQTVLRRLLGEPSPGSLAARLVTGDVPCVECRRTIAAERSNVGPNGPTCDGCWRAHQNELIARSESEHVRSVGKVGALVVAGLLLGALAGGSSRRSS